MAYKAKSHEIFRFTASTVDIPTRWNPRAKQQPTGLIACGAMRRRPVRALSIAQTKKKNQYTMCTGFSWCDGRDSNPRPTDSQEPNGTFCPFHHLTLKRHFNRITVILPLLFCCILCIACTSLHLLSILSMCRKCAKVCSAKISPAKQAVSHSPKSWISTVFIVQNLPVLSRQQSYMTHRFFGRV